MATSLCKSSVLKIYQDVIGDVINNVEDIFTEDGVDSQVLQQLRQTWEAKLMATKAVDTQTDAERQAQERMKELNKAKRMIPQQSVAQIPVNIPPQAQQPQMIQLVETKLVPIQIKLPVDANSPTPAPVFNVQIPAAALQANQLQKVLTSNMIATLMSLPPPVATNVLQQQINAFFLQQPTTNKIIQGDGNFDSSDDDDDDDDLAGPSEKPSAKFSSNKRFKPTKKQDLPSDISDDDDIASENDSLSVDSGEEKPAEVEVEETEPLNSDDDVSEEEQTEFYEVDNVVVCQYDKITRNRNKWKFHMKSGIMNLNGEDYLFDKINGEAEW